MRRLEDEDAGHIAVASSVLGGDELQVLFAEAGAVNASGPAMAAGGVDGGDSQGPDRVPGDFRGAPRGAKRPAQITLRADPVKTDAFDRQIT